MSYYKFNIQETLQKAKEKYSKEKAVEYYLKKQRNNKRKVEKSIQKFVYRKKHQIKEYQRKRY